MFSNPEVIRVCNNIDINSVLMDNAKRESDNLDLNTTAPFKRFQAGQACVQVIDSMKNQISQKSNRHIVLVLLPGATDQYIESTCIAVPIKKDGLPSSMITRTGLGVGVNWNEEIAWEVLEDVKPAAVDKSGGTLLLWRLD